ncbi:MAG TPA: insulinase family protein, partial [Dysgonamonadaceae bacterium]|nr:insulinase family protein [Dysgonamonadaceae bacterium]
MHYQSYTLSNGLRIIHQPFSSNISYCGIVVNAGSRDEYPDEIGLAHFVEHMLFKGTEHRRAYHIANRMESVGGEMNAYTTKEETYIYSTFLEPYFARAVELLSDVVFHSEFRQHEIERERDVVLDEINSYIDTPSEQIYDDFENL